MVTGTPTTPRTDNTGGDGANTNRNATWGKGFNASVGPLKHLLSILRSSTLLKFALVCIIYGATQAGHAAPQEVLQNPTSPGEPAYLGFMQAERYRSLLSELEAARKILLELEGAQSLLQRDLQNTNGNKGPDSETITNSITALQTSLARLKAVGTNDSISANDEVVEQLNRAFRYLSDLPYQSARALDTSVGRSYSYDEKTQTEGERIIRRLRSRAEELGSSRYDDRNFLDSTYRLTRILSDNRAPIRRDLITAQINAADQEVQKFTPEQVIREYQELRKYRVGLLQSLNSELEREIEVAKKRVSSLTASIEALSNTALKQAETAKDKAASEINFNQQSFVAVYAMLGIVLMVFVLLRFFPEGLAKSLIDTRTMIEVVSMAFLLLVILILGNGKFLQQEALGTLLGTIAGYIFGRRSGKDN